MIGGVVRILQIQHFKMLLIGQNGCAWKRLEKYDKKRDIINEVKSQFLIEFACKELENIIGNGGTDLVNKFRKAMEEYMNYA